jgi:hypothetical protein
MHAHTTHLHRLAEEGKSFDAEVQKLLECLVSYLIRNVRLTTQPKIKTTQTVPHLRICGCWNPAEAKQKTRE